MSAYASTKCACLIAAKSQFAETLRKLTPPNELDWQSCTELSEGKTDLNKYLTRTKTEWTDYLEKQKLAFDTYYTEVQLLAQFFEKLDPATPPQNPTRDDP